MAMTISEKILAAHCGREKVEPGEIIQPKVDMVFGNELGCGLAIHRKEELLKYGVFDKSRIAIIPDHFTPNKDIQAAEQCKKVREFAREQQLEHYFEVGRLGIEHIILHEKGLVSAGEIIVGADSHTCTYGAMGALAIGVGSTDFFYAMMLGEIWLKVPETIKVELVGKMPEYITGKDIILNLIGRLGIDGAAYKVLEFSGDGAAQIPLDGRFTICNMAVEAGAKTASFGADRETIHYMEGRTIRPYTVYESDKDAKYAAKVTIDVSTLDFQVACPHSPGNVKDLGELAKTGKRAIDQVFIGSCTNGRIEDLRWAAKILKGRKVHPHVRLIMVPGSQDVYKQALKENLLEIFIDAGAAVCTPTCGPCIGGHMGILAAGETCVATTNRNFRGRMGHMDSNLYLTGVPAAAASAVCGYIASPGEM